MILFNLLPAAAHDGRLFGCKGIKFNKKQRMKNEEFAADITIFL